LLGGGAFLAQRLALARGQRGEELVERGVAAVVPVELDVAAREPAGALEQRELRRLDEGGVRRGEAVEAAELLGGAEQRGGVAVVGEQQARAGRGGEGRGDLQLRIVVPAGALPGVGPGVVEHVFALAVALGVGRKRSEQPAATVLEQQRGGGPAGAGADAARVLERGE